MIRTTRYGQDSLQHGEESETDRHFPKLGDKLICAPDTVHATYQIVVITRG